MTEKIVTTKDLINEVRKVAEAEPDFVYNEGGKSSGCSYFGPERGDTSGSPCIVGKALKNLEVNTKILLARESDGTSDRIGFALFNGLVPVTSLIPRERAWLDSVQNSQDCGLSWAVSVKRADISIGRI